MPLPAAGARDFLGFGSEIENSSFQTFVSPNNAVVDVSQSDFLGAGLLGASAGVSTSFTVQSKDTWGNTRTADSGVAVMVEPSVSTQSVSLSCNSTGQGAVVCTYTCARAGNFTKQFANFIVTVGFTRETSFVSRGLKSNGKWLTDVFAGQVGSFTISGTYPPAKSQSSASSCQACPVGSVSSASSTPSVDCVANSGAVRGAGQHIAHQVSSGVASDVCVDCLPGSGKATTSSSAARSPCPAGTYGTSTGAQSMASCSACMDGQSCPSGSTVAMPCPAGSFCVAGVAQLCDEGFYSNGGASICTKCGAGTFIPPTGGAGPEACAACPAGTSNPLLVQYNPASCVSYAVGTYAPSPMMAACEAYPPAKNQSSASSCQVCSVGNVSSASNTSRVDCVANSGAVCGAGLHIAHQVSSGVASDVGVDCLPGSSRNGVTSNTFESMVQLQVAAEGKNKMLCYNNTLTLSIHMHKAPPTQHTPPRPRVSQHAHARTAPRLGAAGGEGGQCASPTSFARGGYTYLSLVKRMCPWVRPSRASPPRTQLVHTPRRGVYSPPQARCRAHSHWLLGLSTGDGPTLRVGPPPSASLTAAPLSGRLPVSGQLLDGGGACLCAPLQPHNPLWGALLCGAAAQPSLLGGVGGHPLVLQTPRGRQAMGARRNGRSPPSAGLLHPSAAQHTIPHGEG